MAKENFKATHPDKGGVQCAHGNQSGHGDFSSVSHCIFNCNEEFCVSSTVLFLMLSARGESVLFFLFFLASCFMHWLGLLDVLRKGAAFSLRDNDAETFDLARSSSVDEGIYHNYRRWLSNAACFKHIFLRFLRRSCLVDLAHSGPHFPLNSIHCCSSLKYSI